MTWCYKVNEPYRSILKGLRCDHCGKFISYKRWKNNSFIHILADRSTELEFIQGEFTHRHKCQECQIKERE